MTLYPLLSRFSECTAVSVIQDLVGLVVIDLYAIVADFKPVEA